MTDRSFHQARTDAEAGHVRQATEALRRVLERDPADADAVALLTIVLTAVFAQACKAYDGGWLGQLSSR